MDFWERARTFASDTVQKSQELTKEAARRSQEFTIGSSKFTDLVSETAKKSKDFAFEATKKADLIKTEAFKRADQIKTLAENNLPPINSISSLVVTDLSSSVTTSSPSDADLEKFGVTDDLREFVKGITINTFQDFPIQDEVEISVDVPTVSNVRQDLTEWQEKHATFVLLTVKEISKLRYQLCPRFMKERKFWKIYFILVNSHVAPYEKRYTEELKTAETVKGDTNKSAVVGSSSKPEATTQAKLSKTSTSSEQDLDVFLLGDLGSDDDGPDDGDGGFDDDFDNLEDEDEKPPKK